MSSVAKQMSVSRCLSMLVAGTVIGAFALAGSPGRALGADEKGPMNANPLIVGNDDPLPAGCTLRFGTSRYRLGTAIMNMWTAAMSLGLQGVFMGDVCVAERAIAARGDEGATRV